MGIVEDFHAAVGEPANDNDDFQKWADSNPFVVMGRALMSGHTHIDITENSIRAFTPPFATYPSVIALAGPAGSGKSTAARHLIEQHGYTLVKFAGPLKAMMRAIGLTDEHIEGSLKEVPCKLLCGKTPRWAMQSIGSNWARDMIGPDLWRNIWFDTAADVLDQGGRVVCDDMRFANEEAAVRDLGGKVFEVQGRGGIAGGHVSEAYRPAADTFLSNLGTVAQLHAQIDYALAAYDEMARGVVQEEAA